MTDCELTNMYGQLIKFTSLSCLQISGGCHGTGLFAIPDPNSPPVVVLLGETDNENVGTARWFV